MSYIDAAGDVKIFHEEGLNIFFEKFTKQIILCGFPLKGVMKFKY